MKSVAKIAGIFSSLMIAVLAEWALNDSRRRTAVAEQSVDEYEEIRLPSYRSPTTAAA